MKKIKTFVCLAVSMLFQFAAFAQMRPDLHFTPEKNWTNDPNGLVYFEGKYHLFHQYNPFGIQWGHMSWGHAVSSDLIKWEYLPVALQEYDNGDGSRTMFFSGTAVADTANTSGFGKNGKTPLIAIYTAHRDSAGKGMNQSQSMAYSLDGIHFTRYAGNPLIDLNMRDFRDPKVFWHEETRKWVMIVVKPHERKVEFYGSPDLKNWKFLDAFGNMGDVSRLWECPDIFEMPVENEPGKTRWVITVSGGHPAQNNYTGIQYFTGVFDGYGFTADANESPLYIDHGKDVYAAITYNNIPASDNRRILVGWATNLEYAGSIPADDFRGQMTIPRSLHLYKSGAAYRLRAMPVKELEAYREAALLSKSKITLDKTESPVIKERVFDMAFILEPGKAEKAGLRLFQHGDNETLIYYSKTDHSIKIDRTKSGNVSFGKRFPSVESVALPKETKSIPMRILADKNIVEVFVDNGKFTLTDLVFPVSENLKTRFFAEGGNPVFRDVKAWKMKKP